MWRPLARRSSLYRRTGSPRLHPATLHPQVSCRKTEIPPPPSIDSASHFSHFSRTPQFHQYHRCFSSISTEIHDAPPTEPLISEGDEITGSFDSGAQNVYDENSNPDLQNEDSIFDDAVGNLEANDGLGDNFEGSVVLVQKLDAEDEGTGHVTTNDLEKENLIGFFRWALKKPEFKVSGVVLDALVSAVCIKCRKREAYDLWDLVNEIGEKEKGIVSTKSLNALIAEFSRLGKGKAAFDVFNKFEEFGCCSNSDTCYLTIEALCKRSFNNWTSLVCEKMLNEDKLPDSEKVGKIISHLCKRGMTKNAHLVYIYAKDKKISPPQSSVDFLICSLSCIEKVGTGKEINKELDRETASLALETLNDYYSRENRKYAIKPFSSVVKKLCWIGDVYKAKKLLLEMIDLGPPPGNAVFNCVINGLTKTGDMGDALSITKLMVKKGLKPDVYTYTVIMSGYASVGEMEKACEIFGEAKKNHSKLSPVMYHTLIRGFCKVEQYGKAVSLLGEMKKHGVKPSHDEYNKLIKSLCFKALDWETAQILEEEMRENGVILNRRTRALISAIKELKEGESPGVTKFANETLKVI